MRSLEQLGRDLDKLRGEVRALPPRGKVRNRLTLNEDVRVKGLAGGHSLVYDGKFFRNQPAAGPANFGPHVLIEQNSPIAALGISTYVRLSSFDTIYTDDPDALTTSSVIPPSLGLTGYLGGSGPDALPFDTLRATEPGFWLVSYACQIDDSDPTQLVAPFIEGDYMSPVSSPFLSPAASGAGLSGEEFGVTWLTALRVSDEIVCGVQRDDASASWPGITYAAARILRLA